MTDKERIKQLEEALKQSNNLLKSIRYRPEQINFNWDDTYIPQYLLNQIEENGKVLMEIKNDRKSN